LFVIAHEQSAGFGETKLTLLYGIRYEYGVRILRARFAGLYIRKIDTAFAVAATSLFYKQTFIHHAPYIKNSGSKNEYD
jgi:hypothetical protein